MHYTSFQDIFARNEFSTCINSALENSAIEKRSSDSPVSSYYILSQKTTQWILAKSIEMKY